MSAPRRTTLLALLWALVSASSCAVPAPVPQPLVRFVAVGDTGTGEADQALVATAIHTFLSHEKVDFVVLLGDNFYPSGVTSVIDPQWKTKYEDLYGSWGLPVYAVLGNHDYGGNGAGDEPAKAEYQLAYALYSPTWKMPAHFYRQTFGAGTLVALDTNALRLHPEASGAQKTAVTGWLATSSTSGLSGWKIVLGHHPYLSNGPHGNASGESPAFAAFFDEVVAGHADLYLAGHDHGLQLMAAAAGHPLLVVAGGGGATLTHVNGSNPTLFRRAALGFAVVEYDATTLKVRLLGTSGEQLATTTLSR
ncbi:MAG: metallophosphoesterase [Spirochaetales bacterium]